MEFKQSFVRISNSPHEFEGTGEVEWKFPSRTLRMDIKTTFIKDKKYLIETSIGNERFTFKRDLDGPDAKDEISLAIQTTVWRTKDVWWVRIRDFYKSVLEKNPHIERDTPGVLDQMVAALENCPS